MDNLCYVTAYLKNSAGCTGTGFFFGKKDAVFLITNKHCLTLDMTRAWTSHVESVSFVMHSKVGDVVSIGDNAFIYIATVQVSLDTVIWHPSDEVDLCAIRATPYTGTISRRNKAPFAQTDVINLTPHIKLFDETCIGLESDLLPLEPVVSLGYPLGLWDQVNIMPLMRTGNLACVPSFDFLGRPEGVVDMACYAGASGSPVFVAAAQRLDRTGTTVFAWHLILVGVTYGVYNVEGAVTIPVPIHSAAQQPGLPLPPGNQQPILDGNPIIAQPPPVAMNGLATIPSHTTAYVKASQISVLLQHE